MFTRIGTRENVDNAKQMLAEFDPRIEEEPEQVKIYAPDGDVVFHAMQKDENTWICRYHEEVFAR